MTVVKKIKERRDEIRLHRLHEKAKYAFQIQELNGQLWLTSFGVCVLPCEMLKEDPLSVLVTIRELWVKRMLESSTLY